MPVAAPALTPARADTRAGLRWAYWLVCAAAFLAFVVVSDIQNSLLSFNDYVQFYEAGRLAGTPRLYDASAAFEIQRELSLNTEPSLLVVRPPFYALAYRPLAALGYWPGYAVFQAVNFTVLAALVWAAARMRASSVLLIATSIPLLSLFGNGQDCLLAIAIAMAALYCEKRGRPFTAGLLFALCSIKFNLFVLLPVAIVAQKRWRILAGGVAGGAVLAAVSCAVAGWEWPAKMLASASAPAANLHPEQMPTIHGALASLTPGHGWAEAALTAAVIVLTAWAARNAPDFSSAVAIGLAGSLLACYHAYLQDAIVLIASYVLAAENAVWTRRLLVAAIVPPLYLGMLAGTGYNAVLAALIAAAIISAGVHSHANALFVNRRLNLR